MTIFIEYNAWIFIKLERKIKIVQNQSDVFLFGENYESLLAGIISPCYIFFKSVIVN